MSKLNDLLKAKTQPGTIQPAATPAKASLSSLLGKPVSSVPRAVIQAPTENPADASISLPPRSDSVLNTASVETVKQVLAEVQAALTTDAISDVLQRTMVFLKQNPELCKTLLPEEIGLLTQAAYQSQGVVIAQKVTNSANRKKSKATTEAAMADLADLEFNL